MFFNLPTLLTWARIVATADRRGVLLAGTGDGRRT